MSSFECSRIAAADRAANSRAVLIALIVAPRVRRQLRIDVSDALSMPFQFGQPAFFFGDSRESLRSHRALPPSRVTVACNCTVSGAGASTGICARPARNAHLIVAQLRAGPAAFRSAKLRKRQRLLIVRRAFDLQRSSTRSRAARRPSSARTPARQPRTAGSRRFDNRAIAASVCDSARDRTWRLSTPGMRRQSRDQSPHVTSAPFFCAARSISINGKAR